MWPDAPEVAGFVGVDRAATVAARSAPDAGARAVPCFDDTQKAVSNGRFLRHHQRIEFVDVAPRQRHADEAAPVARHELSRPA